MGETPKRPYGRRVKAAEQAQRSQRLLTRSQALRFSNEPLL
jgi:hypothetical protein